MIAYGIVGFLIGIIVGILATWIIVEMTDIKHANKDVSGKPYLGKE